MPDLRDADSLAFACDACPADLSGEVDATNHARDTFHPIAVISRAVLDPLDVLLNRGRRMPAADWNGPRRFRKKSLVIEAIRYTGENADAVNAFMGPENGTVPQNGLPGIIHTLEGPLTLAVGAYVLRGIRGEIYPHDPEFFGDAYDEVE